MILFTDEHGQVWNLAQMIRYQEKDDAIYVEFPERRAMKVSGQLKERFFDNGITASWMTT
jgi:hypothetical protein